MAAFRLQIVITNNYFVEEFSSALTEKKFKISEYLKKRSFS